jgi:hypothetical protein
MDPATLAAAAVGLLIPFLKSVGEKIADRSGDVVVSKLGTLYERIRDRLRGDSYEEQLLAGVAADPASQSRQRNLQSRLAELFETDDTFRADIESMVQEAHTAGAPTVVAESSGITAGGNVVQSAGGDAVGRNKNVTSSRRRR